MNEPSRISVIHKAKPKLFLCSVGWAYLFESRTPGHQQLAWDEHEARVDHATHLSSSSKEWDRMYVSRQTFVP